jgi:hypothetical protein
MFARERARSPRRPPRCTSPRLIAALDERGIGRETLTLMSGGHLPAGQGRRTAITRCTPNGAGSTPRPPTGSTRRARGGRLIAVGTTSLRLLESADGEDGVIRPFEGDTAIFITPATGSARSTADDQLPPAALDAVHAGQRADGLERMQAAYAHAIERDYRFYSYGDASCCCRMTPAFLIRHLNVFQDPSRLTPEPSVAARPSGARVRAPRRRSAPATSDATDNGR